MNQSGFIYGGDYNPEQWLAMPEILEQDIEYMKEAHINEVTLGVFSWSVLEPEEGVYHLEWLEKIMDQLYKNEISVILSTPSAARPKWLADKYPEVLRVNAAAPEPVAAAVPERKLSEQCVPERLPVQRSCCWKMRSFLHLPALCGIRLPVSPLHR